MVKKHEEERIIRDLDPMRILDAGMGEGFYDAAQEIRRRLDSFSDEVHNDVRRELENLELFFMMKYREHQKKANPDGVSG